MPLMHRLSAWLPIALTLGILSVLLLSISGVIPPDPSGDEGAGAHLFQIWLVLEFFTVAFFALIWLPRERREAAKILALQAAFALIPLAIVFSLGL